MPFFDLDPAIVGDLEKKKLLPRENFRAAPRGVQTNKASPFGLHIYSSRVGKDAQNNNTHFLFFGKIKGRVNPSSFLSLSLNLSSLLSAPVSLPRT